MVGTERLSFVLNSSALAPLRGRLDALVAEHEAVGGAEGDGGGAEGAAGREGAAGQDVDGGAAGQDLEGGEAGADQGADREARTAASAAKRQARAEKLLVQLSNMACRNSTVIELSLIVSGVGRCNSNNAPLGAGTSSVSTSLYQIKYMGKETTEVSVAAPVLLDADKKVTRFESKADDAGTDTRRAMNFAHYVLNHASMELAATQACACSVTPVERSRRSKASATCDAPAPAVADVARVPSVSQAASVVLCHEPVRCSHDLTYHYGWDYKAALEKLRSGEDFIDRRAGGEARGGSSEGGVAAGGVKGGSEGGGAEDAAAGGDAELEEASGHEGVADAASGSEEDNMEWEDAAGGAAGGAEKDNMEQASGISIAYDADFGSSQDSIFEASGFMARHLELGDAGRTDGAGHGGEAASRDDEEASEASAMDDFEELEELAGLDGAAPMGRGGTAAKGDVDGMADLGGRKVGMAGVYKAWDNTPMPASDASFYAYRHTELHGLNAVEFKLRFEPLRLEKKAMD